MGGGSVWICSKEMHKKATKKINSFILLVVCLIKGARAASGLALNYRDLIGSGRGLVLVCGPVVGYP